MEVQGPVEAAWEAAAFTAAEAVGIALDDPDDPNVAVAVQDGQIVYLGISDPMLRIDPQQLTDVINATILIAFGTWKAALAGEAL